MRTEKEMLDSILGFANNDERIRAVILNGSRANPNAPRDIFQDYDIVYIVTSVDDFVRDRSWISGSFGDLIIMQTPDEMDEPNPDNTGKFTFLMLFCDGNRIDLTLFPQHNISKLDPECSSLLLLDKDGTAGPLPPASDKDYITLPPSEQQFANCCNEFWWVSTYIAKGLWRRELSYAKSMYEGPVRDMLILMLRWHIGIRTYFAVDPGKLGKYYEKYLEPGLWKEFVSTYPNGEYENIWGGLAVMCDLFRVVAMEVAGHFDYRYPALDDERVTAYLQHVRNLPQDADRIY
jgi:aminoglycoside 6-adenylyltransferase